MQIMNIRGGRGDENAMRRACPSLSVPPNASPTRQGAGNPRAYACSNGGVRLDWTFYTMMQHQSKASPLLAGESYSRKGLID